MIAKEIAGNDRSAFSVLMSAVSAMNPSG